MKSPLTGSQRYHMIAPRVQELSKRTVIYSALREGEKVERRILVACHELTLSGGLFRFERVGRELEKHGYHLSYVSLAGNLRPQRKSQFPLISLEDALHMTWSSTMVPGQGFPDETIERMKHLTTEQFGRRVQHVLNEPQRKEGFLRVHRMFRPDTVIFNNREWKPVDLAEFGASQIHVIEGAVDSPFFSKALVAPQSSPVFTIGGLANKNPVPLIEALQLLPSDTCLRLFGTFRERNPLYHSLIDSRRITFCGPIPETNLPDFYAKLDCVVHTELFAGWSNLAAEALASGVPLVCTPHGTKAFAFHESTALLMQDPTPHAIQRAVTRLRSDPQLASYLVANGLRHISGFTWGQYAQRLLEVLGQ